LHRPVDRAVAVSGIGDPGGGDRRRLTKPGIPSGPGYQSLFAALFLDERLELALHCFEGVVDYFAQRLMHAVRGRIFVRDQFVAGRDRNVNSDPEWVPRVLGVVGMLDHDVASTDVIAKAVEARGLAANEFVELIRFLDSPIRNSNR
jgi:hypothetical protein